MMMGYLRWTILGSLVMAGIGGFSLSISFLTFFIGKSIFEMKGYPFDRSEIFSILMAVVVLLVLLYVVIPLAIYVHGLVRNQSKKIQDQD